jgi:hypothetical protein
VEQKVYCIFGHVMRFNTGANLRHSQKFTLLVQVATIKTINGHIAIGTYLSIHFCDYDA